MATLDLIDIGAAFDTEPPPLDYLFPGGPLAGTVGALVSAGSTGKSYWALQAAAAIAGRNVLKSDLLGLDVQPDPAPADIRDAFVPPPGVVVKHVPGRVVMFAGEDPPPILISRMHAIGKQLTPEARTEVRQRFALAPVMGRGMRVTNPEHLDSIINYCQDARLVVFDTLSRIHDWEESDNGQMSRLISLFERIAVETGATVLYLHHISKATSFGDMGDHQHAGRGATALTDNARWVGALTKMTAKEAGEHGITDDERHAFVRFSNPKNNYAASMPDRWYRRGEGGVLLPATLQTREQNKPAGRKVREPAPY